MLLDRCSQACRGSSNCSMAKSRATAASEEIKLSCCANKHLFCSPPTLPWDTHTHRVYRELAMPGCCLISLNNENFFMSEPLLDEDESTRTQHTVHSSAVGSHAPKKGRESPSLCGKIRRYSCKLPCPAPVGRQVALKVPALNMRLYVVLSWI